MRVRGLVVSLMSTVAIALIAVGCGTSHGTATPNRGTMTPTPGVFTACNPVPSTSFSQQGESALLMMFRPGTTTSEMNAVANELIPRSRGAAEADLASGIVSVDGATCSPPEIEIGYRSSLSSEQLAELDRRLLAEPRVIRLEPVAATPQSAPTVFAPASPTVFLRPVLCSVPPSKGTAASTPWSVSNVCSSQNPASIPSAPTKAETPSAPVVLPKFDNSLRYVLGPADLTARDLASAVAMPPTQGVSSYQVELNLTANGLRAMNHLAAARYAYYQQNSTNPAPRSMEAIEIGGVVQSAPVIQASRFSPPIIITYPGYNMTLEQANNLVQTIDKAIASS